MSTDTEGAEGAGTGNRTRGGRQGDVPEHGGADEALAALRARGYKMTPQRRAIVAEIMRIKGHHIAPQAVAQRVKERLPGVNDSTVYRTLDLLEEIGVVSHAHLEHGHEYHRAGEHDHVHLVCSKCGRHDLLPVQDTEPLRRIVAESRGFSADFTHFAIAGLCRNCQAAADVAFHGGADSA
jgi:Fur family transcriptional regulator, ferric uptake regulator